MIKNKKFEMNMQKKLKNFTAKPDPSTGIIKPFRNDDPNTYPVNQKETLSAWDVVLKSARNDIKKGDYSGISKVKKILNDDYKKSGGEWMNDEEKKLIGKFKPKIPYEPINFNLNLDITKSRLNLERVRKEMAISKVQDDIDRKKFLKKINSNRRTENSGLAYLINPIEEI
jgi:hypothetical protein